MRNIFWCGNAIMRERTFFAVISLEILTELFGASTLFSPTRVSSRPDGDRLMSLRCRDCSSSNSGRFRNADWYGDSGLWASKLEWNCFGDDANIVVWLLLSVSLWLMSDIDEDSAIEPFGSIEADNGNVNFGDSIRFGRFGWQNLLFFSIVRSNCIGLYLDVVKQRPRIGEVNVLPLVLGTSSIGIDRIGRRVPLNVDALRIGKLSFIREIRLDDCSRRLIAARGIAGVANIIDFILFAFFTEINFSLAGPPLVLLTIWLIWVSNIAVLCTILFTWTAMFSTPLAS